MRMKLMLSLAIGAFVLAWAGRVTLYEPIVVLNATPFPLEGVVAANAGRLSALHDLEPVVSEAVDSSSSVVGALLSGSAEAAILPAAVLLDSRANGHELMAVALMARPGVIEEIDDGIALVVSYSMIERNPERVALLTRVVVNSSNAALDDLEHGSGTELRARLSEGVGGEWLRRHAAAMRSDSYRVGDASPALWIQLSDRLRGSGVIARPVHPGSVYTDRFLPYPIPTRR